MSELLVRDRRSRGWFSTENYVVDSYVSRIGAYGFLIFGILNRFSRNGETFVSLAKIALIGNCSLKTVQREIDTLVRVGLLERRSGKDKGIENIYTLVTPKCTEFPQEDKPVEKVADRLDNDDRSDSENEGGLDNDEGGGRTITAGGLDNDALYNKKNNTINKTKNKTSSGELFTGDDSPSKKRKDPKSDWQAIVARISESYEDKVGQPCPWDGQAFKKLKTLVDKNKNWPLEIWILCIENRFLSDGVNTGKPPHMFINDLPKYVQGPLDRYGKLKGDKGNGKYNYADTIKQVHANIDRRRAAREVDYDVDLRDSGKDGR